MASGHVYAVETTLGPWSNGGTSSYEVAISENGGGNWTNLMAFPSSVCAESPDGNHLLVYFQALAGRSYRLRVYDPGDDFTDNTGSISVILYNHVVVGIAPWQTCGDNYSLTQIAVANNVIPANSMDLVHPKGTPVTIPLTPGSNYAIEISQSSGWYLLGSPGTLYFASDISKDNGSNWSAFGPSLSGSSSFAATCVIQTNQATSADQATYRVYFTAGNGIYQMRVDVTGHDSIGLFGGNLNYILYSTSPVVTQNPPPGSPGSPIITPPEWDLACYESYLRPSGFFEDMNFQIPSISFGSLGTVTFPIIPLPIPAIDQWISYLEWSVRSYFAWCAEDSAALSAITTTLNGYEPFGTINDTVAIMRTLQNNLATLQTSGGEGQAYTPYSVMFNSGGGESGGSSWQGILPVLGSDSPWMGGQLKWGSSGGTSGGENAQGGPFTSSQIATGSSPITELPQVQSTNASPSNANTYYYYCVGVLAPHVGQGTAVGECGALSLAKTAPLVWTLVQLIADASAVFMFVLYIQKKWVDLGASG
jgi:hypothetical protein